MSADAEAVNLMLLIVETENGLLVDVVTGDNDQIGEPGQG